MERRILFRFFGKPAFALLTGLGLAWISATAQAATCGLAPSSPPNFIEPLPDAKPWSKAADRAAAQERPLVLMYHDVVARSSDLSTSADTTAQALRSQLAYLVNESGYESVPIERLDAHLNGAHPRPALPPKTLIVTFDDSYASSYRLAAPILREFQVHATFFINSWLMGKVSHPKKGAPKPFLSWDEARALDADPLFDIQVHGRAHPRLTTLSGWALEGEILGAQCEIESALGGPRPFLAYPYGAFNAEVKARAKKHYRLAFSVFNPAQAPDSRFNIERFPIRSRKRGDGRFEATSRASFARQIQAWNQKRFQWTIW